TMDVPAPLAGVVKEIGVKVGDKVSEGTVIVTLTTGTATGDPVVAAATDAAPARPASAAAPAARAQLSAPAGAIDEAAFALAYAGHGVRKLARELGVAPDKVTGSGNKGRILKEDVEAFAKSPAPSAKAAPAAAPSGSVGGIDLLPWPKVDFAKFGPIEAKPLSRIKKMSGANLHRNWVLIPHVTNHDDADITDLEAFRVTHNIENEKSGIKVTMLAFLIKACVAGLKKFPDFNTSLDGDNLIFKQYYNIGFAADTPNGLVVPVIKQADQKGLLAIAKEMTDLSAKAREGKLGPADMQGGCFSISSLGGIGGT